jgi:hypothetical protein
MEVAKETALHSAAKTILLAYYGDNKEKRLWKLFQQLETMQNHRQNF